MNEKFKTRFIIACVYIVLAVGGFCLGQISNQARIDDALRLARQERELAEGLGLDLSRAEEDKRELEQQLKIVTSGLDASEKSRRKLEYQIGEYKKTIDYRAELDRQTRESLERLAKAVYGN